MRFFKNVILITLLLATAFLAAWLAGEILLRRAIPYEMGETPGMYVKSKNKALNKELKPGYEGVYYGGKLKINSAGFRDYEHSIDKPESVYRIIVLGDSMSFGQGLELENIYAKKLEHFLSYKRFGSGAYAGRVDVLNFAVPGYNTIQEYELLRTRAVFYKPDLIIVNFFLNDILPQSGEIPSRPPGSREGTNLGGNLIRRLSYIKDRSYFAQYALSRVAVFARRMGARAGYISEFSGAYADDSEGWIECRKGLLDIKQLAEKNNSKLLLVIVPFLSDLTEYHPLKKEMDIVEDFCAANGIDALNLFPYFKGHKDELLWVSPINGHPNAVAHYMMAEIVGNYILEKELTEGRRE